MHETGGYQVAQDVDCACPEVVACVSAEDGHCRTAN
jgi:hypothetical protein